MSLILEALRKSEAERQRGRAPGLFVAQAPLAPRRSGPPAWAWALGALLLAVLAGAAWLAWPRPAAPETAGTVASANTEPRLAEDTRAAPSAATAPATSSVAPTSAAATVVPAPAPVTIPSPSHSPAPVPAPIPAPSREPIPAPTAAPSLEPIPAPTPTPAPPSDALAPASTADQAATVTALPATAPEPAPAPLPTLAQLSASARAQLPPLKLSMHVYAASPAQRFVILDGQRLGEGASPAPGVVVQEIRRDGLVLSVNGDAVLLTRP